MKINNTLHPKTGQSMLEEVLRVHSEPYEYYDDWLVHKLLTEDPIDYIDHIIIRLMLIADGSSNIELPDKLVFDDGDEKSDFRVMPCVIRSPGFVSKTVKIVGTNGQQQIVPDQITVGKAFALDPEENYIIAGFAGCILSSARTGACVASAVRLLAERSVRILVAGAGRVGYYSALYICAMAGTKHVRIYDTNSDRATRTAYVLQDTFPGIDIAATETDAEHDSFDIVILATDSRDAILGGQDRLAPLTVSVGADTHWQHEISSSQLARSRVYVDTRDSFNCGDLKRAIRDDGYDSSNTRDLFTLLREGPLHGDQPSLFISTGSALYDNLTIEYIMNKKRTVHSKQR